MLATSNSCDLLSLIPTNTNFGQYSFLLPINNCNEQAMQQARSHTYDECMHQQSELITHG
jgi:hypothetical protein